MKLKKWLLVTLFQIVLILTLSAQVSDKNKINSGSVLETSSQKTYTRKEVQAIIETVLDEADISIKNAYQEGYKQATLELLPEVEYYKTLYNSQKKTIINEKLKISLIGLSTGFLLGNCTGFYIGVNIPTN